MERIKKYLEGLSLISEEKIGDAITIREYAKDHARYFFIHDKDNQWVLLFRDDSEYFKTYLSEKLKEIDDKIRQEYGEYERKEADFYEIVYKYKERLTYGFKKDSIIINMADRRYREIDIEIYDNKIEIPLKFFADIIEDYIRTYIDTYIVL